MLRAIVVAVILGGGSAACGGTPAACADPTSGPTPPPPTPPRPTAPPPTLYTPPGGVPRELPARPPRGRTPLEQQRARLAASSPRVVVDPADMDAARRTAPRRLVRGSSFHSTVTGTQYSFHEIDFYRQPGHVIDLFDPYDPFNYWTRIYSPFFGMVYRVVDGCTGVEHVEPKQDISMSYDAEGRVMASFHNPSPHPPSVTTQQPAGDR